MKYCLLTLLTGSLALAQSTTNSYVTDLNGHRAETSSFTLAKGVRTERSQSINGRQVPLEQIDERVLRDDANGKVTEKIIRKYDPDGRLASTDRIVAEEQKRADGFTRHATTYRSDVNGQMKEAERATTESTTQGATTRAETVIERPAINGPFEAVEKRGVVTERVGDGAHVNETVYRRAMSGDFYERSRQVSDVKKAGGQVIETAAFYEPGITGQIQLKSQTVTTTSKRSDGSELVEVNLYARAVDGRVQDNQAPQEIKEQQLIERRARPDGTVIETLSLRRPSVSDPRRLGELRKISETVCTGNCSDRQDMVRQP